MRQKRRQLCSIQRNLYSISIKMNPEEAPIKNLIDFAIEEATLRIDNEKNPVIDRTRLKAVVLEIITKREKRLKRLLKAEK